jgi:hypothetical protein
MNKYKLIHVIWTDAVSYNGWHDDDSTEFYAKRIYTTGYLIRDYESRLAIAQSVSDDIVGEVLVIPKVNIVKRKFIRGVR